MGLKSRALPDNSEVFVEILQGYTRLVQQIWEESAKTNVEHWTYTGKNVEE